MTTSVTRPSAVLGLVVGVRDQVRAGLCRMVDVDFREHLLGPYVNKPIATAESVSPQGEVVVSHSSTASDEKIGAKSTASVTENAHTPRAKSTFTANILLAISLTLSPFLCGREERGFLPPRCNSEAQPTPMGQGNASPKRSILILFCQISENA